MTRITMLLSNSFRPDPRVLKEAQSLKEAGFDITIICWDRLAEFPSKEILPSGIRVIRIQNVRSYYGIGVRQVLSLPRFWSAAIHLIDNLKPHLKHCHDFDTLPCGLLYGMLHHIPIIYDAHEYYADLVKPRLSGILGTILYQMIYIAEKFFSQLASAVVTVDDTLANIYLRRNKNVLVIGHYPQMSMASTHNPIFTRPELTLLYAGRISIDRGALFYIDLLRCLRKINIPAHLVFAGVITPVSEEEIIHQYAQGLNDFIDYLGWIPYQNMHERYHSADIGLIILQPEPRYIAALPVKLFEYMASGLSVIASNFPAIKSIISETNCGIFVDPQSQPSNIAHIIENWWNDPSIPRALGKNGRQAVLARYNWENQSGRLSELYRSMINK